jgi:signal transduction histidine kinase
MSTRPLVKETPRTLRELGAALAVAWHTGIASTRLRYRAFGLARRHAAVTISDQPWRLGIGIVAVLIPAILLAMLGPAIPVTTPGIVFLVAVACSTYLADWVGGITALLLSGLLLDLLFIGQPSDLGLPSTAEERIGFAITVLSSMTLIWLIQRIKRDSLIERRAAVAARAAANALASVEAAVATHAAGGAEGRQALNESLLRAMVSINRAHVGMLYLHGDSEDTPQLAASYGLDSPADRHVVGSEIAEALVREIGEERRWRRITDLAADRGYERDLLAMTNVKALLGVPLIGVDDRLLGVALIGLFVAHKFTPAEIARAAALASRAAATLQAAVGIDERETALHSATEAKRWLELVIATMPEAVVLAMPPSGRIVAENQAAVDLLGHLVGSDQTGEIETRLTLPDGQAITDETNPVKLAFATGEVVTGTEMLAISASGVSLPVLVSAAPVREPSGPVVAVVAVFRDIAALKEASRLKDEFISVVSHELRSPLTPIRGFVQLVAKELAREGGHEPHVGRLNSIAGHVDRMTRLVDDLLDVSRLKSGSLEIRRGVCDLAGLCAEVIRERSAVTQTHRFAYDAPAGALLGDWDGDRLYQVIDNLVGNALKYTPSGGTVTISAGIDHFLGTAFVTVADDGPGIAAADREQIFSAFYRAPEAAASRIAGLGLGLYICHELIAAHGGSIDVGEAPSGGAAFTVRLPLITRAVSLSGTSSVADAA